jgi:hypothetical protein
MVEKSSHRELKLTTSPSLFQKISKDTFIFTKYLKKIENADTIKSVTTKLVETHITLIEKKIGPQIIDSIVV